MKMNYQLKTKPRKNASFTMALKVVVVFCVATFFISRLFPHFLFTILEPVSKPLWAIRESVSNAAKSKFSFLYSKSSLIAENEKLKQDLLLANLEASKSEYLQKENEVLKGISSSTPNGRTIPARILTRFFETPYDLFYVETGGEVVAKGDKVLGVGGVILGEVLDVYGKIAKVRMYSDPGFTIDAEIAKSSVPLKLVGSGGGNFTVVVPKDLTVNPNDTVIIPAFHSHVIALVNHISETEADSFKTLYLSYPLNIFELSWVQIIHE